MCGQDKRHAVELFGQVSSHRNVPRMRVDNVDAFKRLHLGQIQAHRFKRALEFPYRTLGDLTPGLRAAHMQICLVRILRTPTMHLDLDFFGQLAA